MSPDPGSPQTDPASTRAWLLAPLVLIAVLSGIYLLIAPLSADHAAQEFRTQLFDTSGPTVWNNYWFGGHFLPTYSLLAPAIGAWIGFRIMGVIAVVGTVVLFGLVTRRQWGEAARYGVIWFAVSAAINLYSGRITFALGVMVAAAALYAAQAGRRTISLLLAAATGPASPVAALFLAMLGFSHFLAARLEGRRDRRGLELAAVAFLVTVGVALLFPGGGDQPFVWGSFLPALGLTLATAALMPRRQKLILTGVLVYAAAVVATFLLPTPMGGNVNRLGALLLGPLLVIALTAEGLRPGRTYRVAVALTLALILVWQVNPMIRDFSRASDQPAVDTSFYLPLEKALKPRLANKIARVEVVPGITHWESARIAPEFPLARGWERQTDRRLNALLYRDRLTAAAYRRWLDRLAVAWVALPEADLDFGSRSEGDLIRRGVPYLKEVQIAGPWRLFRVADPVPIVDRPARMTTLTTSGFTVSSARAGRFRVRIRKSPYFRVVSGSGCVAETSGGWTEVILARPGSLRVESRFNPGARFNTGEHCHP